MKIYTKSGDEGETSLFGGQRVKKYHMSIQAYGTIDELNSWCGLVKDHLSNSDQVQQFNLIQDILFVIGSHLASNGDEKLISKLPAINQNSVSVLENAIDQMEKELPQMKNFILPGGHFLSSYCHLSRCVCRRAERLIIELKETVNVNAIIIKFLNRLSDYFFVLSRYVLLKNGIAEQPWIPKKD